ncbi:MAG: hypothetical protein OEV54_05205, partial [Dehalococcoidia bacterium]|nr:hypothetical protein [Dehalococcoidia bacterium]
GKQLLQVIGPVFMSVPAQKLVPGDHAVPVGLDHFLIYAVIGAPSIEKPVWVKDQFITNPSGDQVSTWEPHWFAVPAKKTVGTEVTDITNPLTHVVFYSLTGADYSWPSVQVDDQFLTQNLTLGAPAVMLGVPSLKLYAEPT